MMIKGNQSRRAGPRLHLVSGQVVVYLVSVDLDYEFETDVVKKKKEEKFGSKKD